MAESAIEADPKVAGAASRWADLATPAALLALAWSAAQIAFAIWPTIDTLSQRALHVSFAIALAFAMLASKAGPTQRWIDNLLAILALAPGLYIVLNSDYLTSGRIIGLDPVRPLDYIFGLLVIALLFIASYRVMGLGLAIFAMVFVAYFFIGPYLPGELAHRYSGLERFIDSQYLSLDGLYGVPVGVSVSTVFYFVLFAAIYDAFGGGRLIIELAMALTGRRVGGPAKAAVVASGLLGMVSGSAVANVMSTGIFTIPLMRHSGYSARFAGGVEAAASTGAQLVPPVMGAAAFIMADFLRIPYQTIVLAAIAPSIAYYLALLLMVDLEARRRKVAPISAEREPIRDVLIQRGHLLLPLLWLAYRIIVGFPVEMAAIEASAATVVIGMLRPATRQPAIALAASLAVAAERAVTVALPCALAGIVVAVISFTGLGTKFTGLMITLSGGSMAVLLALTMLASLVLGAGMPTTSAYIMAAVLLAPSLAAIGVPSLAAHFFIFYFAILSMVTPPVALSAYAAAAITGGSASSTGWQAFALSLPGFIIPFAIIIHPGLLLMGSPLSLMWGFGNILLGLIGIAIAVVGWLFRPLRPIERAIFAVLGLVNVLPGLWVTIASALILALAGAAIWWTAPREAGAVAGDQDDRARSL
ncbi:TRAP transporter permease [Rhodoligotrophos defluvii]|uniref:TRAP transporter permease n=1 Tax=Rhodoligotrophos defluvii TaxID=2561934 RepID=UPI0010C9C6C1|nr:TRAP transporter fused permease subunit [Rhodoligotrophos defluvii]